MEPKLIGHKYKFIHLNLQNTLHTRALLKDQKVNKGEKPSELEEK